MIAKMTAFLAAAFWLFLVLAFAMRLFGYWGGDPLVPLLGCVFILISSAGIAQILEVQKQLELVKLSTAYSIVAQDPSILERMMAPEQKADLN